MIPEASVDWVGVTCADVGRGRPPVSAVILSGLIDEEALTEWFTHFKVYLRDTGWSWVFCCCRKENDYDCVSLFAVGAILSFKWKVRMSTPSHVSATKPPSVQRFIFIYCLHKFARLVWKIRISSISIGINTYTSQFIVDYTTKFVFYKHDFSSLMKMC